jgi:hypothetical protein
MLFSGAQLSHKLRFVSLTMKIYSNFSRARAEFNIKMTHRNFPKTNLMTHQLRDAHKSRRRAAEKKSKTKEAGEQQAQQEVEIIRRSAA